MNHQQQISVLLVLYSLAFILWRVHSNKQSKRLSKIESTLQIANEKLAMYRNFVNNTSVEKFCKFINTVSVEAFDTDIKAMLTKYFDKVFMNLSVKHVARLISDIKVTVHSEIIMDAFIRAHGHYRLNLSGMALADAIQNGDHEEFIIINEFLERLPLESKKEQITTAISGMQKFLDIDLDDQMSSDYQIEMQTALIELQKRVE
jgi:hypothetical protein